MTLWAAFALIAIGILAIYMEFFVPAFGIIGIAGLVTIIVTVILGYRDLPDLQATIILLTAIFVTPAAIITLLRRFPTSILGRRLILTTQLGDQPPSQQGDSPTPVAPRSLAGRTGVATTPLHPSGVALIDGTRFSVVTNGEYLETGTKVIVAQHFGARIVVRRAPNTPEGGSNDD